MDCIFCKIVQGKFPCNKVYEDDLILSFSDINPQAPVHLLVIPRKHIATLNDLDREDHQVMGHIMCRIPEIAKIKEIKEYRLVANCGSSAGQAVFHIHFHILGGRDFEWPPG